jgi:hypothetical protein
MHSARATAGWRRSHSFTLTWRPAEASTQRHRTRITIAPGHREPTTEKLSSDPLVWKLVGTWGKIGPIKVVNPAWRWMSLDEAGIVPYAAP